MAAKRKSKSESGCGGCLLIILGLVSLIGYDYATTTPEQRLQREQERKVRRENARREQRQRDATARAEQQRREAENQRLATKARKEYEARKRTQDQWNRQKTHWLNLRGEQVRHNRRCQFFNNTDIGRYCGPHEGRACKNCGG